MKVKAPTVGGTVAGCSLEEALADPVTGEVRKIKLVTDNGSAFKGAAFARFIAHRTEFVHLRTPRRSPGHNGVRERAFGSLKYEHPYRIEIDDLPALTRDAEAYRQIFNPSDPTKSSAATDPSRPTATQVCIPNFQTKTIEPTS